MSTRRYSGNRIGFGELKRSNTKAKLFLLAGVKTKTVSSVKQALLSLIFLLLQQIHISIFLI
jgi:hypothetical protein